MLCDHVRPSSTNEAGKVNFVLFPQGVTEVLPTYRLNRSGFIQGFEGKLESAARMEDGFPALGDRKRQGGQPDSLGHSSMPRRPSLDVRS